MNLNVNATHKACAHIKEVQMFGAMKIKVFELSKNSRLRNCSWLFHYFSLLIKDFLKMTTMYWLGMQGIFIFGYFEEGFFFKNILFMTVFLHMNKPPHHRY